MAKTFITIAQERPIIKCPKCEMVFCVDCVEEDEMVGWSVFAHQTCNETFCFYCGEHLTHENEIKSEQ